MAILCVDDEEINLLILEDILKSEGYEVTLASTGDDALLRVADSGVELVLLDVIMGGLDGYSVCRRIKNDAQPHRIPVILTSSLDSEEDRARGREAGADGFLTKPFEAAGVIAGVQKFLSPKH